MKRASILFMLSLAALTGAQAFARTDSQRHSDPLIERGRYLVAATGCNDCHTAGWRESDGAVPVSQWMTGSNIGYRGPWGTSYPANVRLWFQATDENHWIFSTKTRGGLPPMRWHDIRYLSVTDRRAIFRFIKSLGPAGSPAPANVPPWRDPHTPFINLTVQTPAP